MNTTDTAGQNEPHITKTHEEWMQEAIELAYNNVKQGGKPFGAIITRNGVKIAEGVNEVLSTHDVTAHAELLAIQRACKALGTSDLSDVTLYASGECCPMCMASLYWSRISSVYYSYTSDEEEAVGLGTEYVYKQVGLPREERDIKLQHIPRAKETNDAFALWTEKQQQK